MNSRHDESAEVLPGEASNPLWVITIAMAVFFAAAGALIAAG